MKIRPLGDHVVVMPLSREEVTKAGIVLPDTVDKDKPEQGEVMAFGPGKIKEDGSIIPMEVKVGNRVLFKKYSPDKVKINNKDYLVLSQSDIIAIIEEE
ncbi:MAG: co-chaperone GroES [Candidatus Komeilibacteria bacterium]